jgi:hypothetical protein
MFMCILYALDIFVEQFNLEIRYIIYRQANIDFVMEYSRTADIVNRIELT